MTLQKHSSTCCTHLPEPTHIPYLATVVAGLLLLFQAPVLPASASDDATTSTDPLTCSARFHEGLHQDVLAKARATQALADAMRKPQPGFPGYWLFWDGSGIVARNAYQRRLLATQLINRRDNRMCKRSVLVRGGRIRCLKWIPIPPGYKPPPPKMPGVDPTKPEVSDGERLFAASLSALVTRKGSFSQLRRGTAFYHMAQRATDELIIFASQPHRPTLCTGTQAMLGFYRRRLEPLRTKAREVHNLLARTRTSAVATARIAIGNDSDATPDAIEPDQLIRALLERELNETERAALPTESDPLKLLQTARDILTDERLENISVKKRGHMRKALRNIEFSLYAAHNNKHISKLSNTFDAVLNSIASAHRRSCTCDQ